MSKLLYRAYKYIYKAETIHSLQSRKISQGGDKTVHQASERLIKALKSTPLTIFKPIADLGYFGWEPQGSYKNLDAVTSKDVIASLDVEMKPPMAYPVDELRLMLPLRFASLSPRETVNKYPYKVPDIASIHVAVRYRGVDLSKVSFLFGGSTLEMLATRTIRSGTEFIVALIPGTETLFISSHKEYTSNKSDPGFQFERFATGKKFTDEHGSAELAHLQLMEVGGHLVLFSAEVDAMDSNDDPVEVTSSSPRYWGTNKVYQMISSGSLTMYAGSKYRDSLTNVVEHSLANIAATGFDCIDVTKQESNIVDVMSRLLEKLEAGTFKGGKQAFTIRFEGRDLVLDPRTTTNIFVPDAVIHDLIV